MRREPRPMTPTGRAASTRRARRFGKPSTHYEPPGTPGGRINAVDPDSSNVKTPRGYNHGYNVQAAVNEQQTVIAAEVTIT